MMVLMRLALHTQAFWYGVAEYRRPVGQGASASYGNDWDLLLSYDRGRHLMHRLTGRRWPHAHDNPDRRL